MNEAFALLLIVGLVALLAWSAYNAYQQARKLDMDLSIYLVKKFADNLPTVLLVLIAVTSLGESLIAAFMAEEGVPKTARVLLHLCIFVVSLAGPAMVIMQLTSLKLSVSQRKLTLGKLMGSIIFILAGFFLALGAPVTNFLIGVKQLSHTGLDLIIIAFLEASLGMRSWQSYYFLVDANGYDVQTFSILSALSGTTIALLFNTTVHFIATFFEFYLVATTEPKEAKGKVVEIKVNDAKKEEPKKEEAKESTQPTPASKSSDITKDSIEELLAFLQIDENKRKDIVGVVMKSLEPYINPANQMLEKITNSIALRLAKLTKSVRDMNEQEKNSGSVSFADKSKLQQDIVAFFRDKHADGGLAYGGPLAVSY